MAYSNKMSRPCTVFVTPDYFSQDLTKAVGLVKSVLAGGISLVQIRDLKASPSEIQDIVGGLLRNGIPADKLAMNGISPTKVLKIDRGLGVHIKERDINEFLLEAKQVMPTENIIGCAVHSTASVKQALDIHQPSYFQVGTMYATKSHPGKIPEGPSLIREIRGLVGNSSLLIGIGGIDESKLHDVFESGADGVAVISLLAAAEDPWSTSKSLVNTSRKAHKHE